MRCTDNTRRRPNAVWRRKGDSDIGVQFQQRQHHYHQHANHQKHCAEQLAQHLAPYLPTHLESALEIGCGTGFLTDALRQHSPCHIQHYTLNDLYQSHYQVPNAHYRWLIGDITTLTLPAPLDLILSASALQWIHPLEPLLTNCHHALKAGGLIAISLYLGDHFQELRPANISLPYRSVADTTALLSHYFRPLWQQEQRDTYHFTTPRALLQHIRNSGVAQLTTPFSALRQLPHTLEQQRTPHGIPLTYHALQFIGTTL